MKTIISRDNALIKDIHKLSQHRYRIQKGLYLIEGRSLVEEALRAAQTVDRILVDVELVHQYDELISRYTQVEWMGITPALMKHICHTQHPQGIAAILKQPVYHWADAARPGGFLVILDHLGDPGNVGTIIRTSWAFGVDGILLTEGCVDAYNPKVVRSTMGGVFYVPILENVSIRQIQTLQDSGYRLLGTLGAAPQTVYDADFTGSIAIVIGSEAHGISGEILALCDQFLKIPMQIGVDSLNAAVAGGIILNQAFKIRNSGSRFV